ncbi:MAG: CRTAC1 family protein, partial [Acidobacteriota bacterium]
DATGLQFEHRSADWLNRFRRDVVVSPPTFSGGGIASEDVNGDGLPDLLLVGGAGNALFLNDGRGRFRDVTADAGIQVHDEEGHTAEPRQPLIVDLDNDGVQDLLVTYVNQDHRVYRGLGGGRFEDVSDRAGLGGRGLIGGPATAFDFDGDGRLDIYLCYFGDYLAGQLPNVSRDNRNGLANRLFRNLGGMRFEDVTSSEDLADTGWCQAVSHTDFDLDGRQDIIVANDYGRNAFLRNLGGGRFRNVAKELGTDEPAHSMNVGIADLNWDNHPDLYISNIVAMVKDDRYLLPNHEGAGKPADPRAQARMRVVESNVLHVSRFRDGQLTYVTSAAITRGANRTGWAWDADFFDFDNDGDDDLYCVNGTNDYFIFAETRYVYRDGEVVAFPYTYSRESNVFFRNQGDGLQDDSARSGADYVGTSRSTAYLDYDGDGDLDVAVNNFHAPAVLLRNNAETRKNRWLKVRLVGDPSRGSNRDAIGARMLLRTAEGGRVWREVHGGTGYLSMDPREQHFGLGSSTRADLWIRWPDGEEEILRDLPADSSQVIVQGGSR